MAPTPSRTSVPGSGTALGELAEREDRRAASHRGIEDQRTAGADGQAATGRQGIVIGHDQSAGVDHRAAGIGVGAAEDQCAAGAVMVNECLFPAMLLELPKASVPLPLTTRLSANTTAASMT